MYRLVGGHSLAAFVVDTTSSTDGPAVLRTTIELDREVCDTYRVLVQAVDSSQHTATAQLVVMVTDVNDNAPSFPEFSATSVREGVILAFDLLLINYRSIARASLNYSSVSGQVPRGESPAGEATTSPDSD